MLNRKHTAHFGEDQHLGSGDLSAGTRLSIGKRQTLFRAQEPAPSIYEVLTGAFMVYRLIDDGRRQIIDIALPGSLCGFTRAPVHESSCEALVPSTVHIYDRVMLSTGDATGARLAQKMERQICALADHIALLGRRTTEERLAAFLIMCSQVWKTASDGHATVFRIPMTRVEIGDYLGMTMETVSRGIADFERRGLIRTGPSQGEMRVFSIDALPSAKTVRRNRNRPG